MVRVADGRVRPVNRSLLAFVDALETFHAHQVGLPAGADPSERRAVFDAVRAVDPTAFDDPDGFWPTWRAELAG